MSASRFTFKARLRDLCAMRLLASKAQNRPALLGVNFRRIDEDLFMAATDGRRIGVLRAGCNGINSKNPPEPVTLDLRSFVPDLSGFDFDAMASIEVSESEAIVRCSKSAWVVPVIIDKYPLIESALKLGPSKSISEVILNSKYARVFGKVEEILQNASESSVQFRFTGHGNQIEVLIHDARFYGFVMPVKLSGEKRVRPSWLSKFESKIEENK